MLDDSEGDWFDGFMDGLFVGGTSFWVMVIIGIIVFLIIYYN